MCVLFLSVPDYFPYNSYFYAPAAANSNLEIREWYKSFGAHGNARAGNSFCKGALNPVEQKKKLWETF